jgi:hypothetical protein
MNKHWQQQQQQQQNPSLTMLSSSICWDVVPNP